ncbi:hypothetical protein [Nocardiopsis halotolerans]|uniref:hypothetical protein n=1 Tax=Nocardiopsis halotolerans TaxID=124252 RepID=UPI000366A37E|nr:hypothetical protein [Nocardiopsis halotolerans]
MKIYHPDGTHCLGRWEECEIPGKRATPPEFDLRKGEWTRGEVEQEIERELNSDRRQLYVAEFLQLPRKEGWAKYAWDWQGSLSRRTYLADSGRRSESFADLKEHRDECWSWTGAHESDGRAVTRMASKKRNVRRLLWQVFRKAPDTRRLVVRTCESEHAECVNPFHAELLTRSEAMKRQRSL